MILVMLAACATATAATVDSLSLDGTAYDASEDTTVSVLTVADGTTGNVVTVLRGVTLTVTSYLGGGELTKRGAGSLVICDIDAAARLNAAEGEIFFAKSTGVESLAGAAGLHLDASKEESFTFKDNDGMNVMTWRDVRDAATGTTYPKAYYPSWGRYSTRVSNRSNGLPTVDFYDAQNTWDPCYLLMSSDHASEDFAYGKGPGVTGVREIFLVVKDKPNINLSRRKYQSFLCDTDPPANYNYWFCRGTNGEIWSSDYNETASLRNGTTMIDGQVVPGTSVFPQGDFHVLRATRTNNGRFSALCYDHQSSKEPGLGGGLEIGELLVFKKDAQPSDAVAAEINRRLLHKWLGVQTLEAVSLGAGGRVEVVPGEKLRPQTLTLAQLEATAGEMPLEPVNLALAASGTVNLTIPSGFKVKGNVPIELMKVSGAVTGLENLSAWTVTSNSRYVMRLEVREGTLCAVPKPFGLSVVVR